MFCVSVGSWNMHSWPSNYFHPGIGFSLRVPVLGSLRLGATLNLRGALFNSSLASATLWDFLSQSKEKINCSQKFCRAKGSLIVGKLNIFFNKLNEYSKKNRRINWFISKSITENKDSKNRKKCLDISMWKKNINVSLQNSAEIRMFRRKESAWSNLI